MNAPSNRFAPLHLGFPNCDHPSTDRLMDGHWNEPTKEDLAAMAGGKAPQLTGDPLSDAFEFRKEIQVLSTFISICFYADTESCRK